MPLLDSSAVKTNWGTGTWGDRGRRHPSKAQWLDLFLRHYTRAMWNMVTCSPTELSLWPLVQTMQFQKVKQCIVGYSFSLETRQNESLKLKPLIPGEYLIVLTRLHYHCKRHLLKKPKQTKLNKLYNTILSNKLPQMPV